MTNVFAVLLMMVMMGVVASLLAGMTNMVVAGEAGASRSNQFMTVRVGLQGLAIVLLGLAALAAP